MTTHYKLERDELLAFAKRVYEEACYGYLDLKESVCDGLVREFIEGKQIVSPTDTTLTPFQGSINDYVSGGAHLASGVITTTSTTGLTWTPSNSATSTGALIVNTWDSSNDVPYVRIEQDIRPNQNFQGNESERI